MTFYINVYAPVEKGGLPILLRYKTKEEAEEYELPDCLGTMVLTL